jgi:hypothetical protein
LFKKKIHLFAIFTIQSFDHKKEIGSTSPTHNNFYYPLPKGMKRNVEREKEEVLVRLIYKKT